MATTTLKSKQNGRAKKESITAQKSVQKKLADEAVGKTPKPEKPQTTKDLSAIPFVSVKPVINLDDRINKFEKLRGLANKREQLVQTLANLTRFNYNNSEGVFTLKDASGLSFHTTNTNLIKLVTSHLQQTLEDRKNELETEIIAFEL